MNCIVCSPPYIIVAGYTRAWTYMMYRTHSCSHSLYSPLASNIKSRVNRLSVLAAITSTQQRLKLYNRVPTNGLIVYCGTILTDEGKEKKVNFDFEVRES